MVWNQPPRVSPSPRAAANARSLRGRLTEPEKRLWWHLRHRLPLSGTHFRRQVALGRYVVDFCCLGRKLILEVDGDQHGFDAVPERDAERTAHLDAQGFCVLRFSNAQVMREMDVVLDTIFAALGGTTPTPSPSPQGAGEARHPAET